MSLSINGNGDILTLSSATTAAAVYTPSGAGAVATTVQAKLRESVSVLDFGASVGGDLVAPTNLALATLGTVNPASLIIPKGNWTVSADTDWSAYKNVTFVIDPGAVIAHTTYSITLPQNVETGTAINACFVGTGVVIAKNKDVIPMGVPPGGWLQYSNFAQGTNALKSNTAGTNNFAWGANALRASTAASSNIAIGNDTLKTVTNGGNVIPAVGTFFGQGWGNIAIGDTTLRDLTTGYENLAIGAFSLQQLTTGAWNTAIGCDSQITTTTGSSNTSVGSYVLTTNNGNNNTVMGWAACEVQTTGSNTVYGYVSMNANTTGSLNSAFGANTLRLASTPAGNCTFGLGTLENATGTVDSNCAFGTYAMGSTTGTPIQCGAFGLESLLNTTGNFNNGYGSQTLKALTSGTQNTAVGHGAGRAVVTGSSNTAVGYLALSTANAAATNNTAVGTNALLLATGDGNSALGSGALNGITTETNCTGLGLSAAVTGSNQVQLGNASTTTYAYGAVQNRSDARDKADVRDTVLGLDFINALRPVDFKWDYREDYKWGPKDGSKKRGRFHHGLIAQEVKAACDAAGVDFGGYQNHAINGGKDVLSLGYEELIGPLIKAVQEQQAMIVALSNRVAALEA